MYVHVLYMYCPVVLGFSLAVYPKRQITTPYWFKKFGNCFSNMINLYDFISKLNFGKVFREYADFSPLELFQKIFRC